MEWSVTFGEKKLQVRLPARIPDDVPFEAIVAGKSLTIRWQKATASFFLQEMDRDGHIFERPLPLRSVALERRADEGKVSLDLEFGTSNGQSLSAIVSRYVFGQENRDKSAATKGATLRSPMTGKVLKVLAENRSKVEVGQTIFIIEAMKMENKIMAPISGVISGIKLKDGDLVTVNTKLAQIS
jgi:biotin carboxyl carrier protein